MRSDRICRTTLSSALMLLALRQFSTARPSAMTPMAKIATPSKTSYRAKARYTFRIFDFEFRTLFLLPCCILRNLRLRRQRRVVRRPQTSGAFELDNRRLAVPRWPEYPLCRMLFGQCCWQREAQQRSLAETKFRCRFDFLVLCKNFRTQQNAVFAPNN